jgi:hypothetical protein
MKTRLFPELPLVVVEWTDACGDSDESVDPARPDSMRQFGGTVLVLEPGWLVKICPDSVVCAMTKWTNENQGNHSNTIPLKMVESVKGVDGTLYYERKTRKKKGDG